MFGRTLKNVPVYVTLLLITLIYSYAEIVKIKMSLTYPRKPTITRHPEIIASIDPNTSQILDRETLRITINGEDYTRYLRQSIGSDGGLTLIFRSSKPLPVGKLKVVISGLLLTGDEFREEFYLTVDPASDPEIRPYFIRVLRNPNDYKAYYQLGKIYESRYLLEDAYYYYKKAWEINPSFKGAKKGYERIFAVLGRKAVRKGNVIVDVGLNDTILQWSQGIVLFNLIVENYYPDKDVKVAMDMVVLSDASGRYYKPVGDLLSYVREEARAGRISLEVFAKLNYYLESTPLNIATSDVIVKPYSYKEFSVAFRIKNPKTKSLTLYLAGVYVKSDEGTKKLRFKFPFLR